MVDLHRHSEFSLFDGFGNAKYLAKIAKEKGFTSLGMSEHGNVNGWIKHYQACKEQNIKPILGVECYYQPKFDKEKRSYHLCLFAKDVQGYQNINRIIYEANNENFYYTAKVTNSILKKYHKGVICTSACIASYLSQSIVNGRIDNAESFVESFSNLFGEDFYIEIQPYKILEKGLQESVNEKLMQIANKYGVKCILTSDSHYGSKEDFDTYKKMHQIAKHDKIDIESTYAERYMPTEKEIVNRFVKMHTKYFGSDIKCKKYAKRMVRNLEEIESKVDPDIIGKLEYSKLQFGVDDPVKVLAENIVQGMKDKGVYNNKKYRRRVKKEFEVIKENGFADYFLVVQDYIKWAKEQGIKVGPGRGSVCNSVCAYLLGITEIDSVKYNLVFERFLRMDKKKYPDVDEDFETDRRDEVIQYITQKYHGKAAQVCSYGLYKVDNALNDLFKVCGVESKEDQTYIKKYVKSNLDEAEKFYYEGIKDTDKCRKLNAEYDNIIKHFSKLYHKVRYIGTHAAGVAIAGSNLLNFCAIEKRGGLFSCAYDLEDLEVMGILKFDILGLKTMSEIKELEQCTGVVSSVDMLDDSEVYEHFEVGDTDGIFQFESPTVKSMLASINCDCFADVCAANAMNRPGPLSLGMPQMYAENKMDVTKQKNNPFFEQTKDTYGTVVYQEQIMKICTDIAGMTNDQADKMMKLVKDQESRNRLISGEGEVEKDLHDSFIKGAAKYGIDKAEAEEMFSDMATYSFNQGHATGYSVVACQLMWYKIHYPEYFWFVKLKYANKENIIKYRRFAVKGGSVLLTPHVNGTAKFSVSNRFGDECIQEGLSSLDGIGDRVAQAIEDEKNANGDFKSYVDFQNRMPKRIATIKVFNVLEKAGALDFKKDRYLQRVSEYNQRLYGKG